MHIVLNPHDVMAALEFNGSYAPEIKRVSYNDKTTIVHFVDGTKSVVTCSANDKFDREGGLIYAIIKRLYGKITDSGLIDGAGLGSALKRVVDKAYDEKEKKSVYDIENADKVEAKRAKELAKIEEAAKAVARRRAKKLEKKAKREAKFQALVNKYKAEMPAIEQDILPKKTAAKAASAKKTIKKTAKKAK